MSSEQKILVGFGTVNLKHQSAKLSAWRMLSPWKQDSAASSGKSDNRWAEFPVSKFPEINGKLHQANTTHPEGTIIVLRASWTSHRLPTRDGALILRLRQGAALLNIQANLPHGPDSRLGSSFAVFRGHADILSADEALVYKIQAPHQFIDKFLDPEQVDECFEIEEIVPEQVAKPQATLVHTPQGAQVVEIAAPSQRRMHFRRNQ